MHLTQTATTRSSTAPDTRQSLPLPITLFAPLGFVAFLLLFKLVDHRLYAAFVEEDSIFEMLTVVAYAASSFLALVGGIKLWGRGKRSFALIFLGLSALCLYIAGEEISWGQRLFAIASPEFFLQHNRQNELNTHNLLHRRLLHWAYIFFSGYLAFAWLIMPRLLSLLPPALQHRLSTISWLLVPDRQLMFYFLPTALLYLYFEIGNFIEVRFFGPAWHIDNREYTQFFFIARDQEPIEMLLGFGIMLFIVLMIRRALAQRQAV